MKPDSSGLFWMEAHYRHPYLSFTAYNSLILLSSNEETEKFFSYNIILFGSSRRFYTLIIMICYTALSFTFSIMSSKTDSLCIGSELSLI
jgi:hypothetical protein